MPLPWRVNSSEEPISTDSIVQTYYQISQIMQTIYFYILSEWPFMAEIWGIGSAKMAPFRLPFYLTCFELVAQIYVNKWLMVIKRNLFWPIFWNGITVAYLGIMKPEGAWIEFGNRTLGAKDGFPDSKKIKFLHDWHEHLTQKGILDACKT